MIAGFSLPTTATIGGREYPISADFRDILEIFSYLDNPDLPEYFRWQVALALFFQEALPEADFQAGAEYLAWFIACGQEQSGSGERLLDWQQDAPVIVSDVNAVAGQEIRALPFLHWWTFMAWFHAIGQGQLSTLVSIRDKLRRGQKLESWEQTYYRHNKSRVDLKKRYSAWELAEKKALLALLDSGKEVQHGNKSD